jgi:WD40 repeat protein
MLQRIDPATGLWDGTYEFRLPDGKLLGTHNPAAFAKPDFKLSDLDARIVFNPREQQKYPDRDAKTGKPMPENRAKWVPYWKLAEGDEVAAGQILCMLDESLVTARMDASQKMIKAAEVGKTEAKKGVDYSQEKLNLYMGKPAEQLLSRTDILNDLTTLARFAENLAQSEQTLAKAQGDLEEAQVMLRKHFITSRVKGIVRSIAKRQGEVVRPGEKIFEIQSTEKVRLEGNLDVQYYRRVKRNMMVTVEPALPSDPVRSAPGHRQEVTGVAVSGTAKRPLVVSVGLDGSALVWEPNLDDEPGRPGPHSLPHPVAVRCVACTPPGGKSLAITGADDGKVRVWDLSNPDKLPGSPAVEMADVHLAGVTAIAVSPDGRFAATAAGREAFVWDLAAGKRVYALPAEHRDTITALAFTPQARLVTASKDRSIKVWKIGAEKAAVTRTIDHRSGVVDALGVSPDGGRMLFDQDKGRIDLVSLSDGQTAGQLTNVGPSVAFATLALFAPNRGLAGDEPYMIVTAGGEGDLKGGLQVWQAPRAGGRGAEIARLITPGRAPVACAAFSPHKERPFLVVGTASGGVHLWTPAERGEPLKGRITNIDASDPRYVTVRVEMTNAGLLDRSAATVIVNPGQ